MDFHRRRHRSNFRTPPIQNAAVPTDTPVGDKDCMLAEVIGPIRLPINLAIVQLVVDDGGARQAL